MKKTSLDHWVKLFNEGNHAELERQTRIAINKKPKNGLAWKALSTALRRQGKDSMESAQKACELRPNDWEVWFNLGVIYTDIDKWRAGDCFERALTLDSSHAKVWNNYGNILSSRQRFHDAMHCFYTAAQLDPKMVEAMCNLGNSLLGLGKYSKACDYLQRALEIDPDMVEAHSNMIFALDLMSSENTESQQNARKLWAEAYTDQIAPCTTHANSLDTNRKLRIGYVSGDFRQHSAARVFGGMLVDYDRDNFDVYCYDNKSQDDDEYTEIFRVNTNWRKVHGMEDTELFSLIQHDRIDILVDLSGHSAQNRLAVFAAKPAPVQVTAWGYATGTGMKQMDYFFADEVDIPENEKKYYTEEIVYLPCVATSYFTEKFPDINELPALKNGYITFGCLNRLHKVTDEAFKIWCEILHAVPNSRMLLKAGELSDPEICRQTMWHFLRTGISEDRITLIGNTNSQWEGHVSTYNLVDLSLDPFPHGGGVSAMEGMMMGVPIVSLRWPTIVGRLSASLLNCVGYKDWIADSADDYVKLAISKAGDIEKLSTIRRQIRYDFLNSYVGNHKAYVTVVEGEYQKMWETYCKQALTQKSLDNFSKAGIESSSMAQRAAA